MFSLKSLSFTVHICCSYSCINLFIALLGRWKQKSKNYVIDYELLRIESEVAKGLLHEVCNDVVSQNISE